MRLGSYSFLYGNVLLKHVCIGFCRNNLFGLNLGLLCNRCRTLLDNNVTGLCSLNNYLFKVNGCSCGLFNRRFLYRSLFCRSLFCRSRFNGCFLCRSFNIDGLKLSLAVLTINRNLLGLNGRRFNGSICKNYYGLFGSGYCLFLGLFCETGLNNRFFSNLFYRSRHRSFLHRSNHNSSLCRSCGLFFTCSKAILEKFRICNYISSDWIIIRIDDDRNYLGCITELNISGRGLLFCVNSCKRCILRAFSLGSFFCRRCLCNCLFFSIECYGFNSSLGSGSFCRLFSLFYHIIKRLGSFLTCNGELRNPISTLFDYHAWDNLSAFLALNDAGCKRTNCFCSLNCCFGLGCGSGLYVNNSRRNSCCRSLAALFLDLVSLGCKSLNCFNGNGLGIANYYYLTFISGRRSNHDGAKIICVNGRLGLICCAGLLAYLEDLFCAKLLYGINTSDYENVLGIGEGADICSCAVLNNGWKLGLSVIGNILCICVIRSGKCLACAVFNRLCKLIIIINFLVDLAGNLLCLCKIACSCGSLIAVTKNCNDLSLIVESRNKMLCFLVMLCSLCTLQLLCEILSVFLEQTVILTHLLLELTGAALNLSFAELALCGRLCAADNGIRIIIDLADVGHWSLYILAVIVIILLNDRRKLGVRSACKNVIGKRCRRLRNLSHGSLLKLLCISVISAYILLESALALICVLTKCLCCLKAFSVKVENASLVFSALCKSFKLFVLILGESVLLISLCKLLLETGNDTVVILDLLLKKRGRK